MTRVRTAGSVCIRREDVDVVLRNDGFGDVFYVGSRDGTLIEENESEGKSSEQVGEAYHGATKVPRYEGYTLVPLQSSSFRSPCQVTNMTGVMKKECREDPVACAREPRELKAGLRKG